MIVAGAGHLQAGPEMQRVYLESGIAEIGQRQVLDDPVADIRQLPGGEGLRADLASAHHPALPGYLS
jgi:hypothetical protein